MTASAARLALGLAAMMSLGSPILAQESETPPTRPETPAAETPAPDAAAEPAEGTPAVETPDASEMSVGEAPDTAAETPPGGTLSTGRSVGPALGGGPEIYVREEHGDWEVRCLRAPEGQDDPCQLYQRLSDQNGNPTADVNFFDLPDGGEIVAGATLLTPLQTLLTAQVTMRIDGGQPRVYPYSFCDANGCYARMGFGETDIAALRRGARATITVVPAMAPDQRAEMSMSLSGFTAGLAAVSE